MIGDVVSKEHVKARALIEWFMNDKARPHIIMEECPGHMDVASDAYAKSDAPNHFSIRPCAEDKQPGPALGQQLNIHGYRGAGDILLD